MAQISKQDFRTFQRNVARAFAATNAVLTDLQRTVEAQGLAVKEALNLTPEQAARYRARIDAVHGQITAAHAIGIGLAELGTLITVDGLSVEEDPQGLTFSARGGEELTREGAPQLALLDLYDLVDPEPEPEPPSRWARWFGRRRAA